MTASAWTFLLGLGIACVCPPLGGFICFLAIIMSVNAMEAMTGRNYLTGQKFDPDSPPRPEPPLIVYVRDDDDDDDAWLAALEASYTPQKPHFTIVAGKPVPTQRQSQ